MANPEHLKILKQGVEVWNQWRKKNPHIKPDLKDAALESENLIDINLSNADLRYAHLNSANLNRANLIKAYLYGGDIKKANLSHADLGEANLNHAHLNYTNISRANLERTNLSEAELKHTNFNYANLRHANFSYANLDHAKFRKAEIGFTTFGSNDLTKTSGLDAVKHYGPSIIDTSTLNVSAGTIPSAFLRGCGLSDWQIEASKLYQHTLANEEINDILYKIYSLRAYQAIQINPLFISYSHADESFIDMMEAYLNNKGIRFWRDVHAATAGRLERQIDRAIRLNPTVLLVLSTHSVRSDWVQHEARLARKLEIETGRDVLCPVALDNSWKDCHWPERLREQIMEYNILDFSRWKNEDKFERSFNRLLEGLDLFYK